MQQYVGTIQKAKWSQGSKSAHQATVLRTSLGHVFRLRDTQKQNAFDYTAFQNFMGKHVTILGQIYGSTLLVQSIQ